MRSEEFEGTQEEIEIRSEVLHQLCVNDVERSLEEQLRIFNAPAPKVAAPFTPPKVQGTWCSKCRKTCKGTGECDNCPLCDPRQWAADHIDKDPGYSRDSREPTTPNHGETYDEKIHGPY
jgi:hypothetical protein